MRGQSENRRSIRAPGRSNDGEMGTYGMMAITRRLPTRIQWWRRLAVAGDGEGSHLWFVANAFVLTCKVGGHPFIRLCKAARAWWKNSIDNGVTQSIGFSIRQ
ncbi:unnamed protein product [Ectocarpus sp. 4 AP-2014]